MGNKVQWERIVLEEKVVWSNESYGGHTKGSGCCQESIKASCFIFPERRGRGKGKRSNDWYYGLGKKEWYKKFHCASKRRDRLIDSFRIERKGLGSSEGIDREGKGNLQVKNNFIRNSAKLEDEV